MVRLLMHCCRLPRELVESQCLEMFKTCLEQCL